MTKENIPEYSVTELSTALKSTIEDKFGYVRIKGELSGINNHSSGHIYLTLKDENAVINGIVWRSSVAKIKIRPEEGLEVICTGKISTGYNPGRYAGRSNYQITIDTMKPAGAGALMAILEERKAKLKSEGLFEIHHKKSIPKYPSTIGVITSPTGAVLQDIKHRVSERFPCNIILWPVPVQGNDAAELIENAIRGFNKIDKTSKISKPEVLILARGGGSIEDLWCFNEERIVRAVFDSSIPLISAVGHETDTTLVDYVSDIRAPTPTAAAEIATPSKDILFTELNENESRLNYSVKNLINIARERILSVQKLFPDHKDLFNLKLNELNNLKQRLPSSLKIFIQKEISNFQNSGSKLNLNILKEKIKNNQNSLLGITNQFLNNNNNNFTSYSNRVNSAIKLLESLSYKSVIKRGFAVIRNSSNKVIGKKNDIIRDNKLSIETKFGIINAEIKDEQ